MKIYRVTVTKGYEKIKVIVPVVLLSAMLIVTAKAHWKGAEAIVLDTSAHTCVSRDSPLEP